MGSARIVALLCSLVAARHPEIYQDLKSRYLHWFEQATKPPSPK